MKKSLSLIALVLVCAMLFAGCAGNNKPEETKADNSEPTLSTEETTTEISEPTLTTEATTADNVEYSLFDISWTRDAEHDTETIRFNKDGSFGYSCGCGNPVNDSDLCEGYTYDEDTKTITLDCIETTDEMVTVIKVVKCDENSLHLDFDGDVRIFEK